MPRICQYCGERVTSNVCVGCGSTDLGDIPEERICKGDPFFYNGYIVWRIADFYQDQATYLFYLGDRLVETITLSRDILDQFVPRHCTAMPFIWDLFELAQGEKEVLRVVEQNTSRGPAEFEIRSVLSEREKWVGSLTQRDIEDAIIAGKRELVY